MQCVEALGSKAIVVVLLLLVLPAATVLAGNPQDTLAAAGETYRVSTSAVTFDYGGVRNVDTYLSPLRYTGARYRIGMEYLRPARFAPVDWVHQVTAGITYENTLNPAGNNTIYTLLADARWGLAHRWRDVIVPGLSLYAGGTFGFDGGVAYDPRNSNNVCSPQVYLHLGLTGMAAYRLRIGRLPLVLRYQFFSPVVGAFYLPDYGQSFYEIYLGDCWNTVTCGYWGNRFDMENCVTVDLQLGKFALRVGYKNNFMTLWENNISMRKTVHAFVVGFSWHSLRFNPDDGISDHARMVNALY